MTKETDKEVREWGNSIGVSDCDKKRNFISVFCEYSSVGGWGERGNSESLLFDTCASCKFKEGKIGLGTRKYHIVDIDKI